MKKTGVEIYVVGVGTNLYSLDEMVKVSSFPPEKYLYRGKQSESILGNCKIGN